MAGRDTTAILCDLIDRDHSGSYNAVLPVQWSKPKTILRTREARAQSWQLIVRWIIASFVLDEPHRSPPPEQQTLSIHCRGEIFDGVNFLEYADF